MRKRNRVRFNRKLKVIGRSVVVLAGFFALYFDCSSPVRFMDGLPQIQDSLIKDEETVSENTLEASFDMDNIRDGSCFTVKINELVFKLKDEQEVIKLLEAAKERYDRENEYKVVLIKDETRVLPAYTAKLEKRQESEKVRLCAGEAALFAQNGGDMDVDSAYEYGASLAEDEETYGYDALVPLSLRDIAFLDKVEIARSNAGADELTKLSDAISEITRDRVKEQIYEVQPGDSLSLIAIKTGVPTDELVAINDTLENENSVIRAGDELIITVPEPELGFKHTERQYYEENYNAPVEYVDNDAWYTTDMKTLQDPVAGYHKVLADLSFNNDSDTDVNILKEIVVMKPVAKIVERGTRIPPVFYKPISGGRLSSPFGKRTAPKKGASTYHKGIDWATPVGTVVAASSGGVVTRAGWGSGYGNVVYINHGDGRETRYGHLSKVLVKPGQKVSAGQKIALSGNTGRSTGPHLHFEILINGSAVNPSKYMQ